MYHCLLIHSHAEGNMGFLQFGEIMNKADIFIHVQVFVWT